MEGYTLYIGYFVMIVFLFNYIFLKLEQKGIEAVGENKIPEYFYYNILGIYVVPIIIGITVDTLLEGLQIGNIWSRTILYVYIFTAGDYILTEKSRKKT